MKSLILSLALLSSIPAFATPGDVGCTGELNGKKLELLLGYDNFGQASPSLIWIDLAGKRVGEFSAEQITGSLKDRISASTMGGNSLDLRFKEGRAGYPKAHLTMHLEGAGLSARDLQLSCEY